MVKILSRAGVSLADTYDVQGSIAGIEQLQSEEVTLVHEMGGTIFSERVSGFIRRITSGAIAQNVLWDKVLSDLPAGPFRILGVVVLADTAARTNRAMVAIQQADGEREIPIFTFKVGATGMEEITIRIVENGQAATDISQLVSPITLLPNLCLGGGQPQRTPNVSFRGVSSGFGAGTVELTLLLYIAFSQIGGISSKGLPVPSW